VAGLAGVSIRSFFLSGLVAAAGAMLVIPMSLAAVGQERDRAKIAEQYKWNLADIYPSEEAWRKAKESLVAQIPEIRSFKGTLAQGPARLADALEMLTRLNKDLARAYVYASMLSDEDTRVSKYQGMQQEMIQIASMLGAEAAYIEPEILRTDKATIDRFVASEERLKIYTQYLDDIQRRRAHTKSDGEEKILASAATVMSGPGTIYGVFADADFPYPSVTLSDGRNVRLDPAAFSVTRASAVRDDRQKVMSAFFGALGKYRATFGSTLSSQIQADVFVARARDYSSSLEAALDGPNIPTSVYMRLVEGVNRHLPTFHRYLKLRQKMMGLTELHYYDLYAPLVESADLNYTPEEAERHILAALRPLGTDYTGVIARAFRERWIDLLPNEGKRSGAYSNGGAYDVHPFILMNYNGKFNDVSTLAHELGHTMHSHYSNTRQPYATSSYPIFVAEVASTFNEALLIDYMLANIKDDEAKLSLLGNYLEGIKSTVFRQTQFAEFELRAHEMAEKGEPVTGEALDNLYAGITRKYYGHDAGITVVDDYIAHEWAFIPHFYRMYYVFQYATSFTASSALAGKVLSGEAGALDRYLTFLGSGGSKYPIDLLKEAGVDMTTDEPLELTIQKMNRVMDDMEKLLAARSAAR
jgi:oligoendopeptidase F